MEWTTELANTLDKGVSDAFATLPESAEKEALRHALHAVQAAMTAHFDAKGQTGYHPNSGGTPKN